MMCIGYLSRMIMVIRTRMILLIWQRCDSSKYQYPSCRAIKSNDHDVIIIYINGTMNGCWHTTLGIKSPVIAWQPIIYDTTHKSDKHHAYMIVIIMNNNTNEYNEWYTWTKCICNHTCLNHRTDAGTICLHTYINIIMHHHTNVYGAFISYKVVCYRYLCMC